MLFRSNHFKNAYFDGTVNCDGLSCDGGATIRDTTGTLNLQDSNNTGDASAHLLRGLDSAGAVKWYLGDAGGSAEFRVQNVQTGELILATANTDRCKVQTDGHFVPAADNTYDLGSSSLRWANIYSADLQLSNEGSTNDVDGTWGKYTIQEGENDLFLINRRTGKKYKFMLEEVK